MQPDALHMEFRSPSSKPHRISREADPYYHTWYRLVPPPHSRWIAFQSYSFTQKQTPEAITELIRSQLFSPLDSYRFFLEADPAAANVCYPIDWEIRQCLQGDLRIAKRLQGRTIFTIQETLQSTGIDLFNRQSVIDWLEQKRGDTSGYDGLCIELPAFCFFGNHSPLSVPWHPGLIEDSYLPLLFHDSYASAQTRLFFWRRLIHHFREVCLITIRDWCHAQQRQFAVLHPEKNS